MQTFNHLVTFFVLISNLLKIFAIRYHNYTLYDAYPKNPKQIEFLKNLERNRHLDVKVLNDPRINEITQIFVHRAQQDAFVEKAKLVELKQEFIFYDVQHEFDEQVKPAKRTTSEKFYERIQSYDDICNWLKEMAINHSDIARYEIIGKTFERRDIVAFSVKQPSNIRYKSLKVIFESGIHGNEWLSVNFATYMIDQLIEMRTDPKWKQYFWYFIPVANPDGYEYSLKWDRLWKKNRRKLDGHDAYGVNLNRNFNYQFGQYDVDLSPDSQNFPGFKPFSEPETQALRNFIDRKQEELKFYFSVHGHGEKLIIPYSDSTKHVVNYHEVMSHIMKAVVKNQKPNTRSYRVGNSDEVLGKLYSGDSASYVKKNYYVSYVVTVHLRDNGEFGLLMPTEWIAPSCQEMGNNLFELVHSTRQLSLVSMYTSTSISVTLGSSFIITALMLCICL